MFKRMMTPFTKKLIFTLFSLFFFLVLHLLFTHHFTYPTQLSPVLYPGLTILLMVLHLLIACLLFMRVYCDSKRFYLVAIASGFMGSALIMTGTLASFPAWFTSRAAGSGNYNDAAIFMMFRHILLASMCTCTALFYTLRARIDGKMARLMCFLLVTGATLMLMALGYLYSSYNPLLSISLIDEYSLSWQALWQNKIAYFMIAMWFASLALIVHFSHLKTLLWIGIAVLCVSAIGTLIIMLSDSHTNSLAWFYSRIFETVSSLIILLVLLCDVFQLYQRSYQKYQISYHNSLHDTLSGLYNRRFLFEHAQHALKSASAEKPVSFVLCDVDYFKRINDRYGHLQGDKVIHFVGQLLLNAVRSHDIAARTGGEEFVLLLNGTSNINAMNIAHRIKSQIAQQDVRSSNGALPEPVTLSMGVYTVTQGNCTIEECLERADKAMYRAKKEGRNRVVNYH
ncbi:GGDEF domain-containing protein [Atlantibacter sp.]|uniref:sensor domain-containing diguanylate cyclase n=1 Tax=Atlantibacter sp. TaxID=1903473 RepID=UPI0028B0446A|nr:GGDEF domain-containing protein [Atlantibacter sp.]